MNIQKFKIGDIITRVSPVDNSDYSFIGERMELFFVGNGIIYLTPEKSVYYPNPTEGCCKLKIGIYSEGWELFVEPHSEKEPTGIRKVINHFLK